jgi:hypothetical protein
MFLSIYILTQIPNPMSNETIVNLLPFSISVEGPMTSGFATNYLFPASTTPLGATKDMIANAADGPGMSYTYQYVVYGTIPVPNVNTFYIVPQTIADLCPSRSDFLVAVPGTTPGTSKLVRTGPPYMTAPAPTPATAATPVTAEQVGSVDPLPRLRGWDEAQS